MKHRFTTLTAAVATAATAASLMTAPAFAATGVTGGTVTWGWKPSFLSYYLMGKDTPAMKSVTPFASDGATYNETTKQITFTIDKEDSYVDTAKGTAVLNLDGDLHFQKHATDTPGVWGLDAEYDDFAIVINGTAGQIIGDYKVSGTVGSNQGKAPQWPTGDDVVLAEFTLPAPIAKDGTTLSLDNVDTTMGIGYAHSMDSDEKSGFYKPGTEMSPMSVTANLGGEVNPDPTRNPDGSLTPGAIAGIVAGVIALLAILGLGAVAAGLIPGVSLPF
ncbi:MAG: HtaA domain-containing protein [Corynebacterium sp.]|nr:HtaA domain-containing protein [Corynebacterium sp.]